ncbi:MULTISPECIES: hypothetical protein [unclassified Microbacterium]|uniref:hypothetical protein n=1 Tax=unclassified Microbacterium TaxID=2609290 RepID=UPI000EA855B6|nr:MULTISPECIES: hypothetical protein [unclassified Microbacterium]MBT2484843.1 hypothetical protein [Microbacterium sp. ISL-108]RKN67713.1 hypothetical protein D7252_09000 [Microbacterium sp. CGR2]
MSVAARKARKRLQRSLRLFDQREAAAALWRPKAKTPTGRYGDPRGLGWISGPEIMARILARRA